jgi:ferredoxin
MKRYTATTLIIALATLVVVFCPPQFLTNQVAGQKRSSRRVVKPLSARVSIDYSNFSHSNKKHQQVCSTCHKVPTRNWRRIKDYPDIVDYPDHEACVSCHRPQFFKSPKPAICSVCHVKVSPRDDKQFAFRNPVRRRQFMIEFPHDKHQDVIANLLRQFPVRKSPEFAPVSYKNFLVSADENTTHYNNCEICHGPRPAPTVPPRTGWIDGFMPNNQTFKAVPISHASCFNCHWKSEQPVKENCAGCHKVPGSLVTAPAADTLRRKSMKFRHGIEQHTAECTTCHINITKAATLRGLKPDVPITSCSTCHNQPPTHVELGDELGAIDKNREFVCVYCHTSDIGRLDPPPGHYFSAGRSALKRRDIK